MEEKNNLYLISIVSIVAIVSIIIMTIGSSNSNSDSAGLATGNTCITSDGWNGHTPYEAGYVIYNGDYLYDFIFENYIYDYTCINGEYDRRSIPCTPGSVPVEGRGACIPPSGATCIDSDSENYFTPGSITYGGYTSSTADYADRCEVYDINNPSPPYNLLERVCRNGLPAIVPYLCPNGCYNGACILGDNDKDGYKSDVDCNDNNANINPGKAESCNNLDDNCNGQIDENVKTNYYLDADADKYYTSIVSACTAPSSSYKTISLVIAGNDCNDANRNINPGKKESTKTSYDDNCNGSLIN